MSRGLPRAERLARNKAERLAVRAHRERILKRAQQQRDRQRAAAKAKSRKLPNPADLSPARFREFYGEGAR